MRQIQIAITLIALAGCSIAQYQDGGYGAGNGGNVNSYPSARSSQYDSNEAYSRPTSSYGRATGASTYPKASRQEAGPKAKTEEEIAAEEEEKKPSQLELMLAQSKFTCANKKDGYYADSSVNCQVFHYCVAGAKHSWMCPEGTVFHQVHLNCVPAAQDICSQTEKYHIVNDYLHKPIEQNYGPNQTVRYHQRYYPEEFLGDPLAPPNVSGIQQYPPPAARPGTASYGGSSSNRPSPNAYSSSNSGDYEDENTSAYRTAPSYPPPSYPPPAQPAIPRSPPKSSFASYPSSYNPSSSTYNKPAPRKVTTYGGGGFSSSSGIGASRSRPSSFDSYEDSSFKPSSYSSSAPSSSSLGYASAGSRSSAAYRQPSFKAGPPSYQPYSAAAAVAPSYKPTVSSGGYRSAAPKPSYFANTYAAGSPRHNNGGNSKPYDYSGVTYSSEDDY